MPSAIGLHVLSEVQGGALRRRWTEDGWSCRRLPLCVREGSLDRLAQRSNGELGDHGPLVVDRTPEIGDRLAHGGGRLAGRGERGLRGARADERGLGIDRGEWRARYAGDADPGKRDATPITET